MNTQEQEKLEADNQFLKGKIKAETALVDALRDENASLKKKAEFLGCLNACGVDNWEGYEQAQEMMEGP